MLSLDLRERCRARDQAEALSHFQSGGGDIEGATAEERARAAEPSNEESIHLVRERWSKLQQNLYKKGQFDISKIPDIYDAIKYDLLHNHHLQLAGAQTLYCLAKVLA